MPGRHKERKDRSRVMQHGELLHDCDHRRWYGDQEQTPSVDGPDLELWHQK